MILSGVVDEDRTQEELETDEIKDIHSGASPFRGCCLCTLVAFRLGARYEGREEPNQLGSGSWLTTCASGAWLYHYTHVHRRSESS